MHYEIFMQRCLQIAELGKWDVSPNPMVGCVIVYDGKIISEGFHQEFGDHHAEVNAIKAIEDKSIIPKVTVYVSLEPCSHFGKTPPCSDLLLNSGVKNVVIGTLDPNPEVAGKGMKKLLDAGINVIHGVLEKDCKELNEKFIYFHENKSPFITLKWAETKNGFIDNGSNKQFWISAKETQVLVHQMRAEHHAILVGYNTILKDNPSLTTRRIKGRNPIRIAVDPKNELSDKHLIFNDESHTLKIMSSNSAREIIEELILNGIQSVLIEGGQKTIQKFIDEGLWNKIIRIKGVKEVDKGTYAPTINHSKHKTTTFFGDTIIEYRKA